jgi:hypothetical protein
MGWLAPLIRIRTPPLYFQGGEPVYELIHTVEVRWTVVADPPDASETGEMELSFSHRVLKTAHTSGVKACRTPVEVTVSRPRHGVIQGARGEANTSAPM